MCVAAPLATSIRRRQSNAIRTFIANCQLLRVPLASLRSASGLSHQHAVDWPQRRCCYGNTFRKKPSTRQQGRQKSSTLNQTDHTYCSAKYPID